MLIRLQQRRGTEAQWTSADPVLAAGEIAFSTDDQTFRVGDGTTAWSSLPYFQNSTDIEAAGLVLLATSNAYTDGVTNTAVTQLTTAIGASQTASAEYTDAKIAALVDSAPETLNTLNEIATALQANDGDISTITAILATKSDSTHTHTFDELSDVNVATATDNQVLYYDATSQTWQPKDLSGIDQITVSTAAQSGSGSLTYDNNTGQFTFVPPVTGVTAGAHASLTTTGPFAASTGAFHTYNDGSQDLSVDLTTTVSYMNMISLTGDHSSSSAASAKLVRVVSGVETDLYNWQWNNIFGKDFSWTYFDDHQLPPGTTITYKIKGQGSTATTYIGQYSDVQLYVQEVAGALGGQPLTPNVAISDITDVDISSLSDGDVLTYDLASTTWVTGSAASSIAQLTDVDLSSAVEGDTLLYAGAANGWVTTHFPSDVAPSLVSFNEQTANYTLVLTDKDKMVEMNSSTALTLSVPADGTVLFPIGTTITIMQKGTGQVTIDAADPATTINYTPGNVTRTQWSSATLVKRDTNVWYLMGDLE